MNANPGPIVAPPLEEVEPGIRDFTPGLITVKPREAEIVHKKMRKENTQASIIAYIKLNFKTFVVDSIRKDALGRYVVNIKEPRHVG